MIDANRSCDGGTATQDDLIYVLGDNNVTLNESGSCELELADPVQTDSASHAIRRAAGIDFEDLEAVAILPVQDVLELDNSARMNMPGTTGPHNWTWRLEPRQLTAELAARLREETRKARRLP